MLLVSKPTLLFILAFTVVYLLTLCYAYYGSKNGRLSRNGVPSAAGAIFGVSCLLLAAVFLRIDPGINNILLPAAILLFSGILDDLFEFSVSVKFLVQTLAAVWVIYNGGVIRLGLSPGLWDVPVTFFWIIGITNAFNHLDIVDGLAASLGIFSAVAFFIVCLLTGEFFRASLFLLLAVSLCGFLLNNYPPAKVYMGNTGSHFIGFLLATAPLSYGPFRPGSFKMIFIASLILGIAVFDTTFVTFKRLLRRRSVFKKSDDHLALCLIEQGYSLKQVLFWMLITSALLCISGVLFSLNLHVFIPALFLFSAAVIICKVALAAVKETP